MDNWEKKYHINNMPADLLMNEKKLREFADMFLAHTIDIEETIKKMNKEVTKKEGELEYVKEKHKTLQEYINFLNFGGHNFAAAMIKDNHHIIMNAMEKIQGYKVCGKEIEIKMEGWQICIKKYGHKSKHSSTTPSRRDDR